MTRTDRGASDREDSEGYFWLTGRSKELIIRSGHNIDPKSIEDGLARHPAVALVAAVSGPDRYSGKVPVAHVLPKPRATVTTEELRGFAASHIHERAAIPRQVKNLPTLPLTAVGKTFKPDLTKLEIDTSSASERWRRALLWLS